MKLKNLVDDLVQKHSLKYYFYNKEAFSDLYPAAYLKIDYKGKSYEAWGVSKGDKDLAFFKALVELIERISISETCGYFFKENRFFGETVTLTQISQKFAVGTKLLNSDNSNGAAVHLTKSKAIESGLNELIERHTILSALYLNIPPLPYTGKVICLNVLEKYKIKFYYWGSNNRYVVVAVHLLDNGGLQFSHACSKKLDSAVLKSFEELTPNIISQFDNPVVVKDFAVREGSIKSFNLYWKYSGDRRVLDFFNSKRERVSSQIPVLKDIYYSEINISEVFQKIGYPFCCLKVISPQAQQLFFDNWNEKYIHPDIYIPGRLPAFPHIIA
ncbi:YcaO-like family protein [Peredibacter starrii]|uniref:YcaO-like family protein n=1 Tax=Peredibacter starrii TaxID=28202 RepID=A0AAX4HSH7_9BACT|nr:YcaO-like family protein [Peredibacter starrii]WPU65859.1 YcaO-like family protein [Peredibacter starrii]